MKRLHLSFNVTDLEQSIGFYSTMFASEPTLVRDGYAKWLLDDPRVNLVIQQTETGAGFSHAGIQTESDEELSEMFERLKNAEAPYFAEGETTCCYHKSEKSWTNSPDGIAWETFFTHHETQERGTGVDIEKIAEAAESSNSATCGCGVNNCC